MYSTEERRMIPSAHTNQLRLLRMLPESASFIPPPPAPLFSVNNNSTDLRAFSGNIFQFYILFLVSWLLLFCRSCDRKRSNRYDQHFRMVVPPFSAPWKFTGHPFLAADLPSSWPGAWAFFRAAATAGRDMFDEHHKPQRPASILSLVVSFIGDVDDDDGTDVGASRPVRRRKGSGRRKGVGPSKRKEKFQLETIYFKKFIRLEAAEVLSSFFFSFL
jgi:hypothetical protein